MNWVRQYILSVVAAAIICAIVKGLTDQKSTPSAVVKLLAGLLMTITVLGPFAKLEFSDISEYIKHFDLNADAVVQTGTEYAVKETSAIIKSRAQAYILDKAQTLGAELEAEVYLSDSSPPTPCAVIITGSVSPYAKQRLMQYITEDLGISEENQKWK